MLRQLKVRSQTKNNPTRHPDRLASPGPTPPNMKKHRKRNHTGSIVAQDKKDRVSPDGSPVGMINKQDSTTKDNDDLLIGSRIRILSLNIEGMSMAKCELLANLLKKHDVDIALI